MVIEYIRYAIEDARASAFVEAYRRAAASLRDSPHCHGFELARCTEDASAFVLRITWDSAEGHLAGFRTSPQFQTFFSAIKPYVGDIKEMRHYTVTDVVWTRAEAGGSQGATA